MIGRISKVRKRDGRLVDFDEAKIADAIFKAACAVGGEDRFVADELAGVVTLFLEKNFSGDMPGIEEIQDMVEKVLIETGHARMAKAYILYRERRARAREQVRVEGSTDSGPLVGNPAKARIAPWSKGRISAALVREADLDPKRADQIAARVEEKVLRGGVQSLTTGVIRSLVESELFLMGFSDRVGRQALVGLPRYDIDRLLRGGKGDGWRPAGVRDLKRTVADAVVAQYALAEVYSAEVVEAHLGARLHVTDVGCPFEWAGAVAHLPPAPDAEGWVDGAALLTGRLGSMVTRELTLTGLVHPAREWAGGGHALGAARRLLGHSALRTLDRRGGRLRLVFCLPALGDEGEARLAEALVREHWAHFRNGMVEGLPEIVLHLPASQADGADGRRALLPALAAAAETGRVRIAFDRDGDASLATAWYRLPAPPAAGDPAIPAGGSISVNVAALAGGGEAALLESLDRALLLAVKALRQKRSFLEALQADPSAPLYRVAAGAHAWVAGGKGVDLVHLVGVTAAVRRLECEAGAAARLAGRLRAYASVRIAEEGRQARLDVRVASEPDREAGRRFEASAGADDGAFTATEIWPLPTGVDLGEVEPRYDPAAETLEIRFPRDAAPAPERLYDAACLLAADPRVRLLRLVPWPDRSVRPGAADL